MRLQDNTNLLQCPFVSPKFNAAKAQILSDGNFAAATLFFLEKI